MGWDNCLWVVAVGEVGAEGEGLVVVAVGDFQN